MPNGTKRNQKRLGAVLSALVMGGFVLAVTLCMLWDYFGQGGSGAETVVILLCAAVCFVMVGGIALALYQRWKEIGRGEEDEARKY